MGFLTKALATAGAVGVSYAAYRYLKTEIDAERASRAREASRTEKPVPVETRRPSHPITIALPKPPGPQPSNTPVSPPSAPQATNLALPLAEPSHPRLRQRINRSTVDDIMTVIQTPTELLRQARRHDPTITLDELTGARLAASEHSSGSFTALCCIIDAEVNRAERKGKTLYQSLTYKDTFGKQGRLRRASTRRDPRMRHLLAARAVLSGQARGISRGAQRFFDPRAQLAMHRKWTNGQSNRRHCHPLIILERWSFDLPWAKRSMACQLNRKRPGRQKQEWVGPIRGVDPTRLLLMRPATKNHQAQYEAARKLIDKLST